MNPTDLTSVFAAVESTQTALLNADSAQKSASDKLAAAQTAKTQADTDDATAETAYNSAIDAAVLALQGAKRVPATTPPATDPTTTTVTSGSFTVHGNPAVSVG